MMNTRKSIELKIKRKSEKSIGTRKVKKKKSTLNIKNVEVSIVMSNIKNTTITTKTGTIKKNDEIGISMVINMIETTIGKEEKKKKNVKRSIVTKQKSLEHKNFKEVARNVRLIKMLDYLCRKKTRMQQKNQK